MGKLKYEKPVMLIEGFVPTQSVAASCDDAAYDMKAIDVKQGDHTCSHKKCGHEVSAEFVKNYDRDGNGSVNVFSSYTGCSECIYGETMIVGTNEVIDTLAELGEVMNKNGAWHSDQHAPVIAGVPIPS